MKKYNQYFRIALVLLILLPVIVLASPDWSPNLRPVKLVSISGDEVVLDQMRWGLNFDGKEFSTIYQRGRIRFSEVDKVYFCVEDFPPKFVAAHISLAFTFKSREGVTTADNKRSDIGIVVSATNRLRKGEKPTSLVKAFFPHQARDPWPLVLEVGTITDRVQNSLLACNQTLKMFPLKLNQKQAELVLKAAIKYSLVDRSRDYYQVLQNNCVVLAFQILKAGLGETTFKEYWAVKGRVVSPACSLPKMTTGYLNKKGLSAGERIVLSEKSRTVTIPTAMGPHTIDLTKMPGYGKAPVHLVPFVIELENYYELADASIGLQRLADLIGVVHPDFFNVLKAKASVDDSVADAIESLVKMVQKNPGETLRYYIAGLRNNRLTNDPCYFALNRYLLSVVQFELNHVKETENNEYFQMLKFFTTLPR